MKSEIYAGGLHHEPLDERCIRLIDIQNARFEHNMLQGFEIAGFSLEDAPPFDALSYCWGDMRLCTGIVFDTGYGMDLVERMFRVTEDLATRLFSILKTQSLQDKPRYLWIDQVCRKLATFMLEAPVCLCLSTPLCHRRTD